MVAPGYGRALRRHDVDLLALLGSVLAVWALRATLLFRIDEAITSPALKLVYSNGVKLLVWIGPALLVSRARHRAFVPSLGLTRLPRTKDLPVLLSIVGAFALAVLATDRLMLGKRLVVPHATAAGHVFVLVTAVGVSAGIEELFFRGFVLNDLAQRHAAAAANVISSLAFVAFHWPHWIWVGHSRSELIRMSVPIFALSLLLGWLFVRSRSVWPSVVAHSANNLLVRGLASATATA